MSLDPRHVSACFITKDQIYPAVIVERVMAIGFGECLFLTNCDSPHRKQELFRKARHDFLFYQDDDCFAPIEALLAAAVPDQITCAMKPSHLAAYGQSRIALLGWGSLFPKRTIDVLHQYRAVYGEDAIYRRESERIMTWLSWPQVRLDLPIEDLPSAFAPDRLSMQPDHYSYIPIVEERCALIVASLPLCEMAGCGEPATIRDHFVPLENGGADNHANTLHLCQTCSNARRSTVTADLQEMEAR